MVWRNSFNQHKALKKELSKKLMRVAQHIKRLWEGCVPENKQKKELEPFFINEKWSLLHVLCR